MTDYPPTRVYRTRVAQIVRLSPHFTRITVRGEDLRHFGTVGRDQRIKLLFPSAGGVVPAMVFTEPIAEWYGRWRLLPDSERGVMRTYTVRAIRPEAQEIDIDFVLHGIDGPASAWATGAQEGDELILLGPDGRSQASGGGVEWQPGAARTVLLAGDETAVPAIAAILETLESSGEALSGSVCLEIPDAEDALDLRAPAGIEVVWLPRSGAGATADADIERGSKHPARHGVLLDEAVRARAGVLALDQRSGDAAVDTGAPGCYFWLAGEAGVVTGLRRHLVRDLGIDRRSITFMGYWRKGRSEPN